MNIHDVYRKILLDTGQFIYSSVPTQVQAEPIESSGGLLEPGTYYYKVTAVDSSGESLASDECSVEIESGSSENAVKVWWKKVAGASSYRIYGRDGDYNEYWTSTSNWFLDKGIVDSVEGTPPLTQTCRIGLEIDLNDFQVLLSSALATYGRQHLKTSVQSITVTDADEPSYTWVSDIPDLILHVEYNQVLPPYLKSVSEWTVPEIFHDDWRYTVSEGKLLLPSTGNFWVTVGFIMTVTEIEYTDKWFFKILTRDFLYALARARRSMRLSEIPVEYDAETLAIEAERIDEELREHSCKWWEVIGGKGYLS
jgi:hypothetical protein